MKRIVSAIGQSKAHPEWSYVNFKAYRNDKNEIIIPKAEFMLTADVDELAIIIGDVVAE